MNITIERNVPIPRRYKSRNEYPTILGSMKVGESFVLETDSQRQGFLSAAKRYGFSITSRKIDGGGYRVWRVEK